MVNNVVIREINEGELDKLIRLYKYAGWEDEPLPSRTELQQLWRSIHSNPHLRYIVADVEGKIVSSCTLTIIPNLSRGARPYGLVEHVVTHKKYRHQGFGKAVLEYALKFAWQENCYKVMLMSEHPETFSFYENAGFKRGIKTGFIAYPE